MAERAPRFAPLEPGSMRLLDYEDYRRIFMPIGWEHAAERREAGDYSYLPENERALRDRHTARLWAARWAVTALHRPADAAVAAIAFFARRTAELDPVSHSYQDKAA